MIAKERNPSEHRDVGKAEQAGAKAEQQMAFYLRRAFGDAPDVMVVNDLRIEFEIDGEPRDALQIDHLVMHRHGFIIVESKSVTGRVSINKHHEWIRTWRSGATGMQSPVLQAHRQAELLRTILRAHQEHLRDAMLLGRVQKGFAHCPVEIVVAISDQGIIDRQAEVPELCKADQVPGRINAILERHRKAATLVGTMTSKLSSNDGLMNFSAEEMQRTIAFFVEHHYPRENSKPPPLPVPPPLPTSSRCPNCGNLLIERKARKGMNPGASFWGCSTYPRCHYTTSSNPAAR